MTSALKRIAVAIVAVCVLFGLGQAQSSAPSNPAQQEKILTTHVRGNFDVKLTPEALADKDADKTLARMSIDKQFHGDLEATSKGEMLSAVTPVKGSAGYVAIERVTGTLKRRKGTFVLQHSATMARGAPHLHVILWPSSCLEPGGSFPSAPSGRTERWSLNPSWGLTRSVT